jgi:predicted RNase H-like HicB family nuclease
MQYYFAITFSYDTETQCFWAHADGIHAHGTTLANALDSLTSMIKQKFYK